MEIVMSKLEFEIRTLFFFPPVFLATSVCSQKSAMQFFPLFNQCLTA